MTGERRAEVNDDGSERCAWAADADLVAFVRERFELRLGNYERIPDEVRDHHETEIEALAGGYSYRQVLELVQNAADAILEDALTAPEVESGRIVLHLAANCLYAANTGAPLSREGVVALLSARSSSKRQNQIGRFGIGFKSLLGLGGRIDVFSRSVSLRFDPERCGTSIRQRLGLAANHPAPALRLAWPVDANSEFDSDPVLQELSQWASTIIRVDISQQRLVAHLTEELARFPGEFLLFLPVNVDLELRAESGISRRIERKQTAQLVKLIENGQESPWQVVDIRVPLTDPEARADATSVHTREELPIAWALPLSAREERAGRFWAFFPTDTPSRIPGILNAPWKVNSDRTALIQGPYNTFLMRNAACLVVSALEPLSSSEDPARPLDMFPRELETREETARPLVDAIWDHLSGARIVADGEGVLQSLASLALHPVDDEEAVRRWSQMAAPEVRAEFIHPTCLRGQRFNRLKVLLRRAGKEENPDDEGSLLNKWIARIAAADLERARNVLLLVKRLSDSEKDYDFRMLLRRTKIIPAAQDKLIAALEAVIAIGVVPAGKFAVHPDIAADKQCRQVLEQVLGVQPLDDKQWRSLLEQALRSAESWSSDAAVAWSQVWNELRGAPNNVALDFIKASASRMRVRSTSGEWKIAGQLLYPGSIVPDHPDLAGILLDRQFHANDESLLAVLKVGPEPTADPISWSDAVGDAYQQYLQVVRPRYSRHMASKRKSPQWNYLEFLDGSKVLAGAPLLGAIPMALRGKLTALLLDRLGSQSLKPAVFGHTTRRDVYEPMNVPSPTCWLLAQHGAVELGGCCVELRDIVAARVMPWVQHLPGCDSIISEIDLLLSGFFTGWEIATSDLKSFWPAAFAACTEIEVSSEVRRSCYESAAARDEVPAKLRIHDQVLPLARCYVTSSATLSAQAQKAGVPIVVLSSEAVEVWCKRGAQNLTSVVRIQYDGLAPDPVSLLDVAPELASALPEESREKATVQACQKLHMRIGDIKTPLTAAFEGGKFLVDLEQLGALPWQERLTLLLREAVNAGWIVGDPERIANDIVQRNYAQRRAVVAAKATLEERLLAAVGGTKIAFLATFDDAVRRAVELKAGLDPLGVARLALAVHGPTVLAALQDQLEKEGLQPPRRWGTQEAFEFAVALGCPPEFGGSRTARRSAELWASGPMPLGALHDYQDRLIMQLVQLVSDHLTKPARAVLSLPTGSGKTRVAVETAVVCALRKGTSVLWIAQTDELCEQAVQSFRQVWANRGKAWTDLRIFRLWGGNPNPVASDEDVPTVIVASIQTLASRILGTLPDWIRDCSLVVIDEAHHAIAPSYTRLLAWLTGKEPDGRRTPPPPLLGLSATPFRGRNEEESHRLARRFDGRLYPAPDEQSVLYQNLQAAGILSEILVEPLNYAQPFVLTDDEKRQIETFDEFPEAAARRMGEDERRNSAIVRAVGGYTATGQVLLFANSVWHASHLAALLQLRGVQAAAVHGGTETSARQYFIKEFQRGRSRCSATMAF